MNTVFLLDSKVRFTQERLSILTPRDRQGLAGRIGVVQTDGTQVSKPTVYFPADAAHLDLRLFGVDPRHLELVEIPSSAVNEPGLDVGENRAGPGDHPAVPESAAPAEGERLSQSDMDNLFD
jgi:hypothetical protein